MNKKILQDSFAVRPEHLLILIKQVMTLVLCDLDASLNKVGVVVTEQYYSCTENSSVALAELCRD